MVNTREIVLDYVRYRLEKAGYNVLKSENPVIQELFGSIGPLTTTKPGRIIIEFGKSIDTVPTNKFFVDVTIAEFDFQEPRLRAVYFAFLNEIFKDKKITWGRLALVIVFTARLAEKAMEEGTQTMVTNIVDWCCTYFTFNMFEEWLISVGGWEKMQPMNENRLVSVTKFIPEGKTIGLSILAFFLALGLSIAMTK